VCKGVGGGLGHPLVELTPRWALSLGLALLLLRGVVLDGANILDGATGYADIGGGLLLRNKGWRVCATLPTIRHEAAGSIFIYPVSLMDRLNFLRVRQMSPFRVGPNAEQNGLILRPVARLSYAGRDCRGRAERRQDHLTGQERDTEGRGSYSKKASSRGDKSLNVR